MNDFYAPPQSSSNKTLILVIIVFVLVLGTLGFIFKEKIFGAFTVQEEVKELDTYHVLIQAKNPSGRVIEANYQALYLDNVTNDFVAVAQGKTLASEKDFVYVDMPVGFSSYIFYWAEGYYLGLDLETAGGKNATIPADYVLEPYGVINISANDPLQDGINEINLSVNASGTYTYAAYCLSWSASVMYAAPTSNVAFCQNFWQNKTFTPTGWVNLTNNVYACGSPNDPSFQLKTCEKVLNESCLLPTLGVLERLKNEAYACYPAAGSLQNSLVNIPLKYQSLQTRCEDYIDINFFDNARTPQTMLASGGFGKFVAEEQKDGVLVDVGAPDYRYRIKKVC